MGDTVSLRYGGWKSTFEIGMEPSHNEVGKYDMMQFPALELKCFPVVIVKVYFLS